MIPFLDHILIEMEEQFGSTHHTVVKLLGLIPAFRESISSLQDVSKIYASDLPSPSVLSLSLHVEKCLHYQERKSALLFALNQVADVQLELELLKLIVRRSFTYGLKKSLKMYWSLCTSLCREEFVR